MTFFAYTDWMGTERVRTDPSANVWQYCTWTDFGSLDNCSSSYSYTDPVAVSPHGYAGYEYDKETGLDHTWFRYYNPRLGRFMTPDPYDGSMDLANPQSLNRYAYVGGNPVNFFDPLGLFLGGPGGFDDFGPGDCVKWNDTYILKGPYAVACPLAQPDGVRGQCSFMDCGGGGGGGGGEGAPCSFMEAATASGNCRGMLPPPRRPTSDVAKCGVTYSSCVQSVEKQASSCGYFRGGLAFGIVQIGVPLFGFMVGGPPGAGAGLLTSEQLAFGAAGIAASSCYPARSKGLESCSTKHISCLGR